MLFQRKLNRNLHFPIAMFLCIVSLFEATCSDLCYAEDTRSTNRTVYADLEVAFREKLIASRVNDLKKSSANQAIVEQAMQHVENGDLREAVLALLPLENVESRIMAIARMEPDLILPLLKEGTSTTPKARAKLIEGDLRLAKNDSNGALDCFRQAAASIARTDEKNAR